MRSGEGLKDGGIPLPSPVRPSLSSALTARMVENAVEVRVVLDLSRVRAKRYNLLVWMDAGVATNHLNRATRGTQKNREFASSHADEGSRAPRPGIL